MEAGQLLALAAVTLALGIPCWLIRDRDSRLERAAEARGHG
ncbi:MAG TPA: hypothetical protein VLC55_05180 [Burkholderiales bacterium]|nr:hypothetical protein [Burkholderiales bacterium]